MRNSLQDFTLLIAWTIAGLILFGTSSRAQEKAVVLIEGKGVQMGYVTIQPNNPREVLFSHAIGTAQTTIVASKNSQFTLSGKRRYQSVEYSLENGDSHYVFAKVVYAFKNSQELLLHSKALNVFFLRGERTTQMDEYNYGMAWQQITQERNLSVQGLKRVPFTPKGMIYVASYIDKGSRHPISGRFLHLNIGAAFSSLQTENLGSFSPIVGRISSTGGNVEVGVSIPTWLGELAIVPAVGFSYNLFEQEAERHNLQGTYQHELALATLSISPKWTQHFGRTFLAVSTGIGWNRPILEEAMLRTADTSAQSTVLNQQTPNLDDSGTASGLVGALTLGRYYKGRRYVGLQLSYLTRKVRGSYNMQELTAGVNVNF